MTARQHQALDSAQQQLTRLLFAEPRDLPAIVEAAELDPTSTARRGS